MKNAIVEFYGQQLITAKSDEGIEYVAMKPLCENLGLDWSAQRQRIIRDEVLKSSMVIITTVGKDNKSREMLMVPTEYLNGWLFGVDVSRLKDEAIKEKIIVYKKECYRVLHTHWSSKGDRLDRLEDVVSGLAKGFESLSSSIKLLSEKVSSTPNVVMSHPNFVTLNPQLSDNKRRKEEFIRTVIDVLDCFEEGISQTALFHRLEFTQTGTTRRWLHEGVGVWWDMYLVPGNGYRYISKPEIVEANI